VLGKCMFIQTLEVLQRRIVHHYHTRVAQQACFGSPPRHVNTHTQAAFLHPAPLRHHMSIVLPYTNGAHA